MGKTQMADATASAAYGDLQPLKLFELAQWEDLRRRNILEANAFACTLPSISSIDKRVIMEKANDAALALSAMNYIGFQQMQSVGGAIDILWLSLKKTYPEIEKSDIEDKVGNIQQAAQELIRISGWDSESNSMKATSVDDFVDKVSMITGNMDVTERTAINVLREHLDGLKKNQESAPPESENATTK